MKCMKAEKDCTLRALRRELAWLLAAKLAALTILWACFFSAPHRPAVDAAGTVRQLALGVAAR